MTFLEGMTRDVVDASRVPPGQPIPPFGPNESGGTLIRPGGRECYPAFWIRDFTLSIDSGMIPPEELRHGLLVTASKQQRGRRELSTGSWVPDGAIADHINLNGNTIFFPGTYDDDPQGDPWGMQPPFGDHFLFTHIAWYAIVQQQQEDFLTLEIDGVRLLDRLCKAFHVSPSCEKTHLVECDEDNRGVNFGFYDIIYHTGKLLFASCLKYRCARQLAELFRLIGEHDTAIMYDKIADTIRQALPSSFSWREGLPLASTGYCAQADVWGAAMGVYVGAFEGEIRQRICQALADHYTKGTIAYRGNIRHLPTTEDYNQDTAWERTVMAGHQSRNRYQNGAYWGTPTGWVCYAIAQVDEMLAAELARDYIEELREGDFRKGKEYGSPWECFHPQNNYQQNPVYLTSVTCPYAAFRRLGWGG